MLGIQCGIIFVNFAPYTHSLLNIGDSFKAPVVCWLGEGNGTPLQYSCLENPMDRGAWEAAVHGVAEGRIRLSDFTFTFHFHALEKEMATHSPVFLPGESQGQGSLVGCRLWGSHRVGHDWSDLAAAAAEDGLGPIFSCQTQLYCWHSITKIFLFSYFFFPSFPMLFT